MNPLSAPEPVLVIDASTAQAVIGLIRKGQCLAERTWPSSRGNPGILVEQIRMLLQTTEFSWSSLGAILVGCGPGQYAGLRVSVTVAQAIQLPAHAKVAGMCSAYALLQTTIHRHPTAPSIVVCGDARRNHVWLYHWHAIDPQTPPPLQCLPASALREMTAREDTILISPDYARLQERLYLPPSARWIEGNQYPTAEAIYQAASTYPTAITAPAIHYVHPPVATPPPQTAPA